MKILKIKLKNINSLKGEHEVDFTTSPLADTGLILITGPTGSGKSTLLDAITLGLYGNVPRLQKLAITKDDIEELGTILTLHTKEASVEVFYEIKGTAYVSKWSVRVNRNNSLNAIEMQLANAISNELLEDKKNDVVRANEELIGLTYDQFQKAILLSQGDFAKFLQSKNEDRLKLLEKMIGADIYRKIGIKSFEYYKRLDAELKMNQQMADNYIVKSDEDIIISNERLITLTVQAALIEEQVKLLTDQKGKMDLVINLKDKLAITKENEDKSKRNLIALQPNIKLIARHDELLNSHDNLKRVRHMMATSEAEKTKILGLKEKLGLLKNEKTDLANHAAKAFPGSEISENEFTSKLDELKSVLVKIEDEAARLNETEKYKRENLLKSIKATPTDYLIWDVKKIGLEAFSNNIASRLNELTDLFTLQAILPSTSTIELSHRQAQLDQRKLSCIEYQATVNEKAKIDKEKSDKLKSIEQAKAIITEAHAALNLMNDQKDVLTTRLDQVFVEKQKQLESYNLTEARDLLQDGAPCPLCGSLDHPYVTHAVVYEIGSLEIEHNEGKKKLQELEKQLSQLITKKAINEGEKTQLQSAVSALEIRLEELSTKIANYTSELGITIDDIGNEIEVIELRKKDIAVQISNLESYRSLSPLLLTTNEYIDSKKKLEEVTNQLKTICILDKPLEKLNEIISTNLRIKKDFTTYNALLNKASSDLEDNLYSIDELSSKLLPIITSKGYKTIDNAFASILEQREVDAMHEEISKVENLCKMYANEVIQINSEMTNTLNLITSLKTVEEVVIELEGFNSQNNTINQEIGEIKGLININAENKKFRDAKLVEIAEQQFYITKWRLLSDLIGDATGKKYANFAQSLTLDMILEIANRRLRGFTNRYSLKRTSDDLFIVDHYMADKERNVRTLSGGETFIVSLALALGLSDLASQNVKLECLFIDEGFGTLDEDTLDLVVTTLEKLQQDSSKTIGIISHIDYLKDRISTQIQLEKAGNGVSTFRIVA